MKKVLPNNAKTRRYLDSLPKIYLVACWAEFGVREFAFSGKCDKDGVTPLVWDYEDCNGTCDEWRLRNIHYTTTGRIYCWTTAHNIAKHISNALNKQAEMGWRCK